MLCSLLGIDVGRYRDRLGMPGGVEYSGDDGTGSFAAGGGDRTHLRQSLLLSTWPMTRSFWT